MNVSNGANNDNMWRQDSDSESSGSEQTSPWKCKYIFFQKLLALRYQVVLYLGKGTIENNCYFSVLALSVFKPLHSHG